MAAEICLSQLPSLVANPNAEYQVCDFVSFCVAMIFQVPSTPFCIFCNVQFMSCLVLCLVSAKSFFQ